MLPGTSRSLLVAAIVFGLVVALACGAVGAVIRPPATGVDSGRVVGRAAFAYMSGLRTFAAAVLWNRLEPQFHEYYEGKHLAEQTYMLPTIRLVQALDPQFEQAYYVGAWIVAQRGDTKTGIELARDGLEANPRSGWMRMNLVSLLMLDETTTGRKNAHLAEEVGLARSSLDKEILWKAESDRFESYGVFQVVFRRAGLTEQADALALEQRMMKAQGMRSSAELEEEHDGHDHEGHEPEGTGDSEPDHASNTSEKGNE